jgi:hypothetical protein
MAVTFNLNAYLSLGSAALNAMPLSMAGWVEPPIGAPDGVILAIDRSPAQGFADFEFWSLEIRSSNNDNLVQASTRGPGLVASTASTPIGSLTFGAQNFAGAVFSSTVSRAAYCNLTTGTDTVLVPTPTVGETYLGARVTNSGTFRSYSGCISDVAIWNVALTDAEMAAMAGGISPRLIRPRNIVFYAPLITNATKTINLYGAPLTVNVGTGSFADCVGHRLIAAADAALGQAGPPAPPAARSSSVYYIERMDNRIWPSIEDAWCLDCALAYPMPAPTATLSADSSTGDAAIRTYNLINGGSGYTAPIGQVVDIEGGGTGATVQLSANGGVITAATAITIGSDYVRPQLLILDTTGTGAVIQPIVTNYAQFTASANVFTDANVGDIIRMGGGRAEVITRLSATSVIGNLIAPIVQTIPNDPSDTPVPQTAGNWTMTTPTTTVTGLAHLEGMAVKAFADGGVVSGLTVINGGITLPVAASQILVGLPFTAQLQTLYMESPGGGTMQTRRKDITQVVLRVENSRAPQVGTNQPDSSTLPNQAIVSWPVGINGMTQIEDRTPSMPAGLPVPLFSGDLGITNVFTTWDQRAQVAVQQTEPLPLTVTALVPAVALGDTPSQG